jgi:transposase
MLSVFAEAVLLRMQDGLDEAKTAEILNTKYGTAYTADHVATFTNRVIVKRRHPYLIHELRDKGLKAQAVADLFGIRVQTVYYHQRQFPKKPFGDMTMFTYAGALQKEWEPEHNKWFEHGRLHHAVTYSR